MIIYVFWSRSFVLRINGCRFMVYLRILIQPLTHLDPVIIDNVVSVLKDTFADVIVDVNGNVLSPPISAYNWSRAQYNSDKVLEWLYGSMGGLGYDVVVGIGDLDAYVGGLNFVFGEASSNLRVCVVYLRRLKSEFYGFRQDYNKFIERIRKEVIHEVGHVLGLGHCLYPGCVMNFSNSIFEVDRKSRYFCRQCAGLLLKRGIKVKEILT